MREYLQNYINGQWVDSIGGRRHDVISPSTEEPCTAIVLGTAADVDAAVKAARQAQRRHGLARQMGFGRGQGSRRCPRRAARI